MIRLGNLLIFSLMITLCGCSGDAASGDKRTVTTVPASGVLTLDGKPFGPIHIDLLPLQKQGENVRMARTNVNEDGTFVLGTYDDDDGAAPGNYKVVLGNMGENMMEAPPAVADTQVLVPEGGGSEIKIILTSSKADTGTGSLLDVNLKKAK